VALATRAADAPRAAVLEASAAALELVVARRAGVLSRTALAADALKRRRARAGGTRRALLFGHHDRDALLGRNVPVLLRWSTRWDHALRAVSTLARRDAALAVVERRAALTPYAALLALG
jgi:hypothetical protein